MDNQKKTLIEVSDNAELETVLPFLKINGIPFELETDQNHETPFFSTEGIQFFRTRVLVAVQDFDFARALVFKEGLEEDDSGFEELRRLLLDEDSGELQERLIFPERFSFEEVELAKSILSSRNELPDNATIQRRRKQRIAVEYQPKEIGFAWSMILIMAAIATPYLSLIFCVFSLFSTTRTPDGDKVPPYGKKTVKVAWIAFFISIFSVMAIAYSYWKMTQ